MFLGVLTSLLCCHPSVYPVVSITCLNSGCFLCRILDFGSLTSFRYLRKRVHKWTHVLIITLGFSRHFGHVLFCLYNIQPGEAIVPFRYHSIAHTIPEQKPHYSPARALLPLFKHPLPEKNQAFN